MTVDVTAATSALFDNSRGQYNVKNVRLERHRATVTAKVSSEPGGTRVRSSGSGGRKWSPNTCY